jgi:hypothetical protein
LGFLFPLLLSGFAGTLTPLKNLIYPLYQPPSNFILGYTRTSYPTFGDVGKEYLLWDVPMRKFFV